MRRKFGGWHRGGRSRRLWTRPEATALHSSRGASAWSPRGEQNHGGLLGALPRSVAAIVLIISEPSLWRAEFCANTEFFQTVFQSVAEGLRLILGFIAGLITEIFASQPRCHRQRFALFLHVATGWPLKVFVLLMTASMRRLDALRPSPGGVAADDVDSSIKDCTDCLAGSGMADKRLIALQRALDGSVQWNAH